MRERLYIDKNEELSDIAKKLPAFKAEEITLVVPQGALIFESRENLTFLKEAALKFGCRLTIETDDPRGMRLAASLGLAHESFAVSFSPKVYDILPPQQMAAAPQIPPQELKEPTPAKELSPQEKPKELPRRPPKEDRAAGLEQEFEYEPRRSWRRLLRRILFILIPVGLVVLVFALDVYLARATIAVKVRRHPVSFSEKIMVRADAASLKLDERVIAGEKIEFQEALEMKFAAKEKTQVRERTRGTTRVVNAFSSSRQALVAGTRFSTPDGKIFRIEKQLSIPGAKVEAGTVVPSSIEALLVADEPGEDGNIKAGTRLTIPGFAGTPKFSGFWAEAKSDFSGGFVGEVWIVRAQDIESAQVELRQSLVKKLEDDLHSHLEDGLSVIEAAKSVDVPSATSSVAAGGWAEKFVLSGTGKLSALAFKEKDLTALLLSIVVKDPQQKELAVLPARFEFASRTGKWDKAANTLELDLRGTAFIPDNFDLALFKERVLGKKESGLREVVLSTPAIESVDLKLSPFWKKSVTKDPERVSIALE